MKIRCFPWYLCSDPKNMDNNLGNNLGNNFLCNLSNFKSIYFYLKISQIPEI